VARTEDFQALCRDLAMQVVATNPSYVQRADVPADVVQHERDTHVAQMSDSGKPEPILERIVDGKMEKFYQEACLLEQPFIKDDSKTVGNLITDAVARLGENVIVRRFVRFEVGV
jgi:elongation factor Ts